jgi:hypothetical protein
MVHLNVHAAYKVFAELLTSQGRWHWVEAVAPRKQRRRRRRHANGKHCTNAARTPRTSVHAGTTTVRSTCGAANKGMCHPHERGARIGSTRFEAPTDGGKSSGTWSTQSSPTNQAKAVRLLKI